VGVEQRGEVSSQACSERLVSNHFARIGRVDTLSWDDIVANDLTRARKVKALCQVG